MIGIVRNGDNMKNLKAYLYGNGKIYYNAKFGFFTKSKDFLKMFLLPDRDTLEDCMINFGLEEKDIIDLRKE